MWYQSSKTNIMSNFSSRWITQRLIGHILAGSDWACSPNCLSQLESRTKKNCHFFLTFTQYLPEFSIEERAWSAFYHGKINAVRMHRSQRKWHCCVWCFFMAETLSSSIECELKYLLLCRICAGERQRGGRLMFDLLQKEKSSISKFGSILPELLPLI